MYRSALTVPALLMAAGAAIVSLAPASAAAPVAVVTPSRIVTDPAITGKWLIDDVGGSNHGEVDIATPDLATGPALRLHLPSSTDKATLQYRYAPAAMPASSSSDDFAAFRALLSSAAYTFSGTNVNYQVGVFFKPNDARYGPAGIGADRCAVASSYDPDWCYTTLKYEPGQSPTSQTTVDVSTSLDQGFVMGVQPGWWRSQRVGQYVKAGTPDDVSLDDMLAEISDVVVYGFGISIGPAFSGDVTGWVKNLTFDGTTYTFGPDEDLGSPYSNSTDLDSAGLPAVTDFVPSAAPDSSPTNLDLNNVDKDKPIHGDLTWIGTGDDYVDLYAFSSPVYIGTFPVIAGKVTISASVSSLPVGAHTFLFVGQSSGTKLIAGFTIVTAGPALAATGVDAALPLAIGGVLLVAGSGMIIARRRLARRAR